MTSKQHKGHDVRARWGADSQVSMTLFTRLYQWLQHRHEQRRRKKELRVIRTFKGLGKVTDDARRRVHLKDGFLTKNRKERFEPRDEAR